ncbi:hepatitis A virus cellular receptor 1 homolog isoform X2 [Scomber scombrus]|uniref:hepatitis A virus cellular receptor 1 homolog isoform X2 n=1 Tax=Scomber scombrus TaxID=13677 RepID=UPI002DD9EC69|nr:hepatitis A virus cellular receptor 1 homolog isoform X2 [Scomber scombrus]
MRGLCYFFLSVLTQIQSSSFEVIGLVGRNVTLPCRYDMQTHGLVGFCWGRGKVPRFKCTNTILSSSDGAILSRASRDPRYQLLGRVTDGDVSLTILNAQWSDAGVYGCRVKIPGWFNDYKVNTYLVMEEVPVEQPITQDYKFATGGRQEVLTTSEVGGTTPDSISDFTAEIFIAEKIQSLHGSGEHRQNGSYFSLHHNHNPRLYFPEKVAAEEDTSTSQRLGC